MAELQARLERLMLRLDRMGMRAEQALADALQAVRDRNVEAGREVDTNDRLIDREEVEIEQECIRLLALYQPAAVDLRTICTIIKINSDLERIADLATSIARRVKHVVADGVRAEDHPGFEALAGETSAMLGKTVRMINATDGAAAQAIIELDQFVDQRHKDFVSSVLTSQKDRAGGVETAMTLIHLAKALERIGDLCTNIAEDIIFLRTGDVVRHPTAFDHA